MTRLNLVVIRASNLERAAQFYTRLGLTFARHRHGKGPEHLSCETEGIVFEIYPRQNDADSTAATRLGFTVPDVDAIVDEMDASGIVMISASRSSE